ncbi:MAG: hypothetical protein RIS47_1548 [Bacteroidota bacterium]|jgi:DNA-binding transcriptional MerR regulator
MSENEPQELTKLYYSIGEVAEMFDVNTSLIRYWEKEFEIINPKKNRKGDRSFTVQDIENIRLIYHLVKEKGMTLKGAKLKLKTNKEETTDDFDIISRLEAIKATLIELKNEL